MMSVGVDCAIVTHFADWHYMNRLETLLPEDAMDVAKAIAGRWVPLFQEPNLMSDTPGTDAQPVRLLN